MANTNDHNEELQPPIPSQDSLNFGTIPPGTSKIFQMLISNPSQKPLIWRADTGEASWLILDQKTGTLEQGEQQPVNVTADADPLALGDQAATLTFTSEGDDSSASSKLPVTLAIPRVLRLVVGLSFDLFQGSSKTLPIAITNRENYGVNWTADIGGTKWLTLDRYSGTLIPHEVQTIYVTANSSSLKFGDYAATLTFYSEAEGIKSADAKLQVELHISRDTFSDNGPHSPVLSHNSRAELSGDNNTTSVQFSNPQSNGEVKWTMGTGGVNWVSLNSNKGTLQGGEQATVVVTTDKSGLQPGNYRTDLILAFTFTDPQKADREPTSVLYPVTLTIP